MTISSALTLLREHVKDRKSESAQAALVAQVLGGMGYRNKPEVHTLPLEHGASMRIYLWTDTPFGDSLVLVTGPSVAPEVLLGKEIPAAPTERGFYLKGGPAHGKTPERILARVARAMEVKVAAIAKSAAKTEARREVARARAEAPPPVVVVAPPPPPPPVAKAPRAPRQKRGGADARLALVAQAFARMAGAAQ